MRLKFLLIIPVLLLLSDFLYGQRVREFSEDPEEFRQDWRDYFDNVRNEETLQEFEWFYQKLEKEEFTEGELETIREFANLMLDRRLRAHPHFGEYLKTMRVIFEEERVNELFGPWHKFSREILPDSRDDFRDFNERVQQLVAENTLFESRSVRWYADELEFALEERDGRPIFVFSEMNLIGDRDRMEGVITIYGTSGILDPIEEEWEGDQGRVTWERTGLPTDQVYADLGEFSFDITRPRLEVDTVQFHNKEFFEGSMTGKLSDRIERETSRGYSYPEFTSYDRDMEIDDLAENMHYVGGFTQAGKRIMGSGTPEDKAKITMFYEGEGLIESESERFLISPENIRSENCETTIKLDEDSIYHPRHNFNYNRENQVLRLSRSDEGVGDSPFFNSYHQLEMDFDGLTWEVGSPQIEVSVITETDATVNFRSRNFYREQDYMDLRGILEYNPVELFRQLVRQHNDQRHYSSGDLARHMDISEEYTYPLLSTMARRGFILYQSDIEEFYVTDKVFTYFKGNRGVRDYDIINFNSRARDGKNATISLLNYDLDIVGVERINMSDTNNVVIFPENEEVTVKENRDMEFDGHIMAGRFDFYGDDFEFIYDDFKSELNNVDSVKFVFPEEDPETGETYMRGIENVIQDVNGVLYFDDEHNKSAMRHEPEYPIFDCQEESYVYYDYDHIKDGVYERDDFYFNLEPFEIDSLNDFTREGLVFEGGFQSADIFPEFDHELKIQDDYSLGFEKETPPGGYEMYQGKGNGEMTMKLSNQGFYGSGEIEYLGSTTYSDEFALYPDSTKGRSQKFEIPDDKTLDYPPTTGREVYTHWRPYEDTMEVKQMEDPFVMYDQEAEFSGELALNPDNLAGDGEYRYRNAVIGSDVFAFEREEFDADTAHLEIESDDPEVFAFSSPNVQLDFDMNEEIVDSRANDDTTTFDFPLNQFKTSIRAFEWDLDEKLIDFETPEEQADDDAWFLSKKPAQDSLWFNSTEAIYDLEKYHLTPREIPHIASADAHLFPDDKTITIEEEADIQTMENARIESDTVDFHHEIYDATVNLFGRKEFAGYGDYDYEDMNGREYTLHFNSIQVKRETQQMVAEGRVEKDEDPFHLGPNFRFYGEHNLVSEREHLNFNGYVLPDHQLDGYRTQWFRHNEVVNPDSLYFNVAEVENEDERLIFSGIFVEIGARPQVYGMLMGDRREFEDNYVFEPDSILYYDQDDGAFVFDNYKSIFEGAEDLGNEFRVYPEERVLKAHGEFSLHEGFEHFSVDHYGDFEFRPNDSVYRFNLATAIDFPFEDDLLDMMADSINDIGFRLPELSPYNSGMRKMVRNNVSSDEEREEYLDEMGVYDAIPYEDYLQKAMILPEKEYVWDPENNSFNVGGEIGIGTIRDNQVNRRAQNSGIQIQRRRAANDFSMYLEITPGSFYFFNFDDGGLRWMVSDTNFEEELNELSEDIERDDFRLRSASRRQIDVLRNNVGIR